ncbi:MAG: hypothetical protein WBD46_11710, partial [Acidobacteriaceae bacterium]
MAGVAVEPFGLSGATFILLHQFAAGLTAGATVGTLAEGGAGGAGTRGVGVGKAGGKGGGGFFGFAAFFLFLQLIDVLLLTPVLRGILFVNFLFGEPAGGRQVGVGGGEGDAEAAALFFVVEFMERPHGLEGLELLFGAEGLAIGTEGDFGDGLADGLFFRFFGAGGHTAREGLGSDVADVGEAAGVGRGQLAGKQAMGGLGEKELDRGVVLKEGKGDFAALWGALWVAVVLVGEA